MYNYLSLRADHMFPDLPRHHVFLTAYRPDHAMTILDPDDVGKFTTTAFCDPGAFNVHKINLGFEALTPGEIAQSLS